MPSLSPPRRIILATLMADATWLRCVQDSVNRDHVEIHSFRDRTQGLQFIEHALPEIVAIGLGVPEFDALGTLDQLLGGLAKVKMAILTLPDCRNNAIEVTRYCPSDYKTRPLSVRDLCDRIWTMRYVVGQEL